MEYVLESLRLLRKCAVYKKKKGGTLGMGTDLTKQREAQLCDFRRLFGIYYFGFPLGFKISTADGSSYF